MFPAAGGQYVYLREAFGPLPAFLFGWTQLLVIQTGTIAAVAVAFARFLGVLVPGIDDHAAGSGPFVTPQRLVAIALLILLTYVNTPRPRASASCCRTPSPWRRPACCSPSWASGSRWSAGGAVGDRDARHRTGAPVASGPAPSRSRTFGPAMVGALFAADAWNNITFTAGEVRDPASATCRARCSRHRRRHPRSTSWSTSPTWPRCPSTPSPTPRSTASPPRWPRRCWARARPSLVACGILISTFGCANGMVLAGARVSYAMAKDGLFFKRSAELNARRRPRRSPSGCRRSGRRCCASPAPTASCSTTSSSRC